MIQTIISKNYKENLANLEFNEIKYSRNYVYISQKSFLDKLAIT